MPSTTAALTPPANPSPSPSTSTTPTAPSGVNLHQAVDAIHTTIELATRQGFSQARIALSPEALGAIRIHISQSSQGLVARITADTAAAAQALADGHAELRQSLSSLGLTALHLGGSAFNGAALQQRNEQSHHGQFVPSSHSRSADPDIEEEQAAAQSSEEALSNGTHVDVLA